MDAFEALVEAIYANVTYSVDGSSPHGDAERVAAAIAELVDERVRQHLKLRDAGV
jgi:hypothetical protein